MSDNEILFDDEILDPAGEEPLDGLLEGEDPDEEAPVEIPEAKPARWSPAGACFPGAEIADDSPRYCQDGVMVDQPSNETTDADSMNFLLAKQKEKLESDEAGPIPLGGSYRDPRLDELQQVLEDELSCPFCNEKFTKEDCDFQDLGQLVSYNSKVYHWACLGLWMLVLCKGHADKAAEIFHVDIRDLRALKTSYRAIPWGRLGFRQPGAQEVGQ